MILYQSIPHKKYTKHFMMQCAYAMPDREISFAQQCHRDVFKTDTFEMKLSSARPVLVTGLAKEQFDAEMKLWMDDIQTGHVVSADDVEVETKRL